ncbi:MAG: hypothetical protein HY859_17360 [Caulobacterales bacterium]|nr:hypothetical protein [Caulobacterales bacterium]
MPIAAGAGSIPGRHPRPGPVSAAAPGWRSRRRPASGRCAGTHLRDGLPRQQPRRGWVGYFRSAHQTIHQRSDQTIRRRLRALLAKRRGAPTWGGGRAHNRWSNAYVATLASSRSKRSLVINSSPVEDTTTT